MDNLENLNYDLNKILRYGIEENLAIALTRIIFRDTKIEEFHTKTIEMDMDFYYKAYEYYDKIIKKTKKFKKVTSIFYDDNFYQSVMDKIKKHELSKQDADYLDSIIYYLKYDSCWDCPEVILNSKPSYSAKYILDGKFLEHCQKGSKLNDKVMSELNHDVCNRFYTLINSGYFKNK